MPPGHGAVERTWVEKGRKLAGKHIRRDVPDSELRFDGRNAAGELATHILALAAWADIAHGVAPLAHGAHGLARTAQLDADAVYARDAFGVALARGVHKDSRVI